MLLALLIKIMEDLRNAPDSMLAPDQQLIEIYAFVKDFSTIPQNVLFSTNLIAEWSFDTLFSLLKEKSQHLNLMLDLNFLMFNSKDSQYYISTFSVPILNTCDAFLFQSGKIN